MKRSELKQMIREELINEIGIDEIAAHGIEAVERAALELQKELDNYEPPDYTSIKYYESSAYKLKIELEYILKSTKRFKDALRRTKL